MRRCGGRFLFFGGDRRENLDLELGGFPSAAVVVFTSCTCSITMRVPTGKNDQTRDFAERAGAVELLRRFLSAFYTGRVCKL